MTNREWLNTLSDEDFAKWCVSEEQTDYNTMEVYQPCPRLNTIKFWSTSSYDGLLKWLKEERQCQVEKN